MKIIFGLYRLSFILFLTILVLLTSCEKLNEEPRGFASPESFYQSISQAEAALIGHMDRLFQYWNDDGYSWGWRFFDNDGQTYGGNLNINYRQGRDLYGGHYKGILYMNNLLRAIKNGEIKNATQDQIDLVTAQAKLMRGFDYFVLVRLFGAVPLYNENMDDPTINPIARTPIAEVYEQIISDFTYASEKLPLKWPNGQTGRPTRGAAKGLLAKTYITMATAPLNDASNYAKAMAAAKSCMDDGVHDLIPNINDVFKVENKYSSEMMWSFNANYKDVAVEANLFAPWECKGWGNVIADARVDSLWPEQPRKNAYLLRDIYKVKLADGLERTLMFVPSDAELIETIHYENWGSQNPAPRKWLPPYISQADYDNYTMIYGVPIIRYADVLLLYAEAANMSNGGPTQAACDALNRVIDRANGNSTGLPGHPRAVVGWTKQQFDDAVIQERNWELCFEMDRWYDVCRKRILNSPLVTPKWRLLNYSVDDYLWPIPQIDLSENILLTQNPGYPTP